MKTYRFTFPDGFSYVVESSEGIRSARESALRDYGFWARRGRDHSKATDLFWALDRHGANYTFEECEDVRPGSHGKVKRRASPEARRKMSLARKGKPSGTTGKPWSEARRKKLVGRKRSAATRKKMSEAHMGQIPWNKGVRCRPQTKQKMRDAQVGKWKWLTDGVRNKCVRMEVEIVRGWWRGRTQSTSYLEIW